MLTSRHKRVQAATITIDNVTVSTRGAVQFKVTMPTFVTVTENGVTDFECGSLQTIRTRAVAHSHSSSPRPSRQPEQRTADQQTEYGDRYKRTGVGSRVGQPSLLQFLEHCSHLLFAEHAQANQDGSRDDNERDDLRRWLRQHLPGRQGLDGRGIQRCWCCRGHGCSGGRRSRCRRCTARTDGHSAGCRRAGNCCR